MIGGIALNKVLLVMYLLGLAVSALCLGLWERAWLICL